MIGIQAVTEVLRLPGNEWKANDYSISNSPLSLVKFSTPNCVIYRGVLHPSVGRFCIFLGQVASHVLGKTSEWHEKRGSSDGLQQSDKDTTRMFPHDALLFAPHSAITYMYSWG